MDDLGISVIGLCCGGHLKIKVLSPELQLFGLHFCNFYYDGFQLILIDIIVYNAEKRNLTIY